MMPDVKRIKTLSPVLVEVEFDGPITGQSRFLDPDIYEFGEGLVPLGVLIVSENTLQISTTYQEPDKQYGFRLNNDTND